MIVFRNVTTFSFHLGLKQTWCSQQKVGKAAIHNPTQPNPTSTRRRKGKPKRKQLVEGRSGRRRSSLPAAAPTATPLSLSPITLPPNIPFSPPLLPLPDDRRPSSPIRSSHTPTTCCGGAGASPRRRGSSPWRFRRCCSLRRRGRRRALRRGASRGAGRRTRRCSRRWTTRAAPRGAPTARPSRPAASATCPTPSPRTPPTPSTPSSSAPAPRRGPATSPAPPPSLSPTPVSTLITLRRSHVLHCCRINSIRLRPFSFCFCVRSWSTSSISFALRNHTLLNCRPVAFLSF